MKKGKTFLTLLSLAGVITVITMTVSNTMTTNLEKELAQKANTEILKVTLPTIAPTATPKPAVRPTLPPSPPPVTPVKKATPTPSTTPAPTPAPSPKKLHLMLPVAGSEVLTEYTEDVLVFQATYGDYRSHLGIDFGDVEGTPVYAASEGIVVTNAYDYEQGYTIEISHEGGYLTRYCNLTNDQGVTVGQVVSQGEQIGTMGTSGIWEAHLPCHLHFELLKDDEIVDPRDYLYVSLY